MIAIEGDMMEHQLGISEEDQETLRNKVSIVFHSAATVRFDEPMRSVSMALGLNHSRPLNHLSLLSHRLAVEMNLLGVRKMVQLCKTFRHLEVSEFTHVVSAWTRGAYQLPAAVIT